MYDENASVWISTNVCKHSKPVKHNLTWFSLANVRTAFNTRFFKSGGKYSTADFCRNFSESCSPANNLDLMSLDWSNDTIPSMFDTVLRGVRNGFGLKEYNILTGISILHKAVQRNLWRWRGTPKTPKFAYRRKKEKNKKSRKKTEERLYFQNLEPAPASQEERKKESLPPLFLLFSSRPWKRKWTWNGDSASSLVTRKNSRDQITNYDFFTIKKLVDDRPTVSL